VSRRIVALALFVAFIASAGRAAEPGPAAKPAKTSFELSADSVEFESARKVYVARGNVRIVSKTTQLTADWMALNEAETRGIATGHVVYRSGGEELHASFVEFDIDDDRGILFNAHFEPSNGEFRLEGDTIVKHDEDRYSFEKGVFTSCVCPEGEVEPWQIRAESADVEIGGYATARNTTFDVLGVPVIWLPWMIYPVKTKRESGLLLPEFGYTSRNGFTIGLPLFWAAADSLNVTLTPEWMSERGYKGDVDLEYVYGEKSSGTLSGAYVYDTKIDPYSSDDPFGRNRWEVHGTQDAHLPGGLRARSKFQFISDNEYVSDFKDLHTSRSDRYLESNAFVGRSYGEAGRFGGLGSVVYFNDLQNPNDEDRDRFLLQRLPTLAAAALPAPVVESDSLWSHLIPAFDFEYTNFVPRHRATEEFGGLPSAYNVGNIFIDTGIDAQASPMERGFPGNPDPHGDDTTATTFGFELDGRFEEGEPLADDGSRFDFFPRLGMPFRIGDIVEAYPEIGWRETVYDTHFGGAAERHLLTARLDLRSRFSRTYGESLVHIVEPRIGYALVDGLGQDESKDPLFIPRTAVPQLRVRQLDLRNVTNDTADRVSDFNGVTLAVANRIYRLGAEGTSDLVADFYASGLFRIDEGKFGNIFTGGRFFPTANTFLWANIGFDPEAVALSEALAEGGAAECEQHAHDDQVDRPERYARRALNGGHATPTPAHRLLRRRSPLRILCLPHLSLL
jgi:lipopolysaccharide export system protein LptA